MICNKCGNTVGEGQGFCNQCGTPVQMATAQNPMQMQNQGPVVVNQPVEQLEPVQMAQTNPMKIAHSKSHPIEIHLQ